MADLHDKAANRKAKQRERREARQARDDVAEIMALPAGRRFMYRLIFDTCGLQNVYLSSDSGIYRNEGARKVGADLALTLQLEHTGAYTTMIAERMATLKLTTVATTDRDEPETGDDE
jgi:hypothetical protein